jgi:hypothetical protein
MNIQIIKSVYWLVLISKFDSFQEWIDEIRNMEMDRNSIMLRKMIKFLQLYQTKSSSFKKNKRKVWS